LLNPCLLSKGLFSLAGILGEAGDLSGFVHGNALLRHAGLNLAEDTMEPSSAPPVKPQSATETQVRLALVPEDGTTR
jgi:hypothetical protein